MDLSDIYADIAAFADNEDDVIIDKGYAIFQRNRQTYECKLIDTAAGVEVEFNGTKLPYKRFLAEELGRLSILAEAIKQKRKDVTPYIDTKAVRTDSLDRSFPPESALNMLSCECQSRPFGETKLVFLTADAGHGKTALLRRLTQHFASAYLAHESDTLLLHIDTQGRSFVRLEEAVAGDLGQLRIAGLFYSGVIRLIRHGLLAIAIDGFDELLAEIGFGEAYSGLGAFLRQLEGNGVVIASARSAYFEVENYAAQTRLLTSLPDTHVTMQLVRLEKWGEQEAVSYFTSYRSPSGRTIEEPQAVYEELSEKLGSDHPVLHRPFLVHRMAALLAGGEQRPGEIARQLGSSPIQVVPNVIHALLKREVEEKWRDPSGQPYLTLDQHVLLLSAVAEEMWNQGKNSLSAEVVQVLGETVLESLGTPQSRRVQIIQRVKAHALLPPSPVTSGELTFDHDEFLNYFLAARIVQFFKTSDKFGLQRFCELHSLPLIVGIWAAHIESWSERQCAAIIDRFNAMTKGELRSTYLKQNAGLLCARLASLHGKTASVPFTFESMYFEGDFWKRSELNGGEFIRCTFIGIDLSGTKWTRCKFTECRIDGLTCDSDTKMDGCVFDESTQVVGVLRRSNNGHGMRSYVPDECKAIVEQLGAKFPAIATQLSMHLPEVSKDKRQALEVFFRIFSRNSGATESVIKMKLNQRHHLFRTKLLPSLLKHDLLRRTEYCGKGEQDRYELNYPLELILKGENPNAVVPQNIIDFWDSLRD